MLLKLLLLAVFGVVMAHLDGMVDVYLKKSFGMLDSESNKESIEKIAPVWFPIGVSSLTIINIAVLYLLRVI